MIDWQKFFKNGITKIKASRPDAPHYYEWHEAIISSEKCEELYQAFKQRLMEECSIIPRMTPEEYQAWKEKFK